MNPMLQQMQAWLGPNAKAVRSMAAPLVVVLGPKGGVGKTTVATNLAVDLAGRGHSTLLIDTLMPAAATRPSAV